MVTTATNIPFEVTQAINTLIRAAVHVGLFEGGGRRDLTAAEEKLIAAIAAAIAEARGMVICPCGTPDADCDGSCQSAENSMYARFAGTQPSEGSE